MTEQTNKIFLNIKIFFVKGRINCKLLLTLLLFISFPSLAKSATVSIDDVEVVPRQEITVPVMLYDSPGIAAIGIEIHYNPGIVMITTGTVGDFDWFFAFNDTEALNGWVTINAYITGGQLEGDVKIADITLQALGDIGDTSPLNIVILAAANQVGDNISVEVDNGIFCIIDSAPSAPTGLHICSQEAKGVVLCWDSNTEEDLNGYKIYRKLTDSNWESNAVLIATTRADITSYKDEDVVVPNTYYYRIKATNVMSEDSGWSNTVSIDIIQDEIEVVICPNPYIAGENVSEKITFSNLSQKETIRIYTISGKLIKTIEYEYMIGGGSTEWDISGISSGIYFYTIISPEGKKTGKVSIIK